MENAENSSTWAERQIPEISMEKPGQETINDTAKPAKQPRLGLCHSLRIYFREYCLSSSLHGIRYLGEKGRTRTERVWWFLIFIASIFMCSQLIMKTWKKWDSTPVIVSFAESPTPVWQVPFPAVTICSETKVRQTIYNFTEAYHTEWEDMTDEEKKKFSDVSLLCDSHIHTTGENVTDQAAIDFLHMIAPDEEEMLWRCKWLNKLNTSCTNLFSKSLTEEGLCYTFNMLDSKEVLNKEAQNAHYLNHNIKSEWSLDKGYNQGADMDVHPKRALGPGLKAGLTVLLRAYEPDLDYLCRGPVQGFKILLHNPEELPRVGQQYFRVPLNQEVIVNVQPDIMTTSEGLKDYLPVRRHCYFPSEKKLRYFKIYTQQNCEIECLTNYTLSTCGCVAFHMPRTSDTPICGSGRTQCVALAQTELLLREVRNELADTIDDPLHQNISLQKCNCLPGCTSLSYNAETSQADFNWIKLFQAYQQNMSEYPGVQLSRVNIFFKDTQFITSRRSELYGQTDFLANCGGLLGLFMGFSFLSLVEIVYFLTLRLWCNVQMHGRRMWNAVKIDHLRGRHPMMHTYNEKHN